jgi:hypothetical protein
VAVVACGELVTAANVHSSRNAFISGIPTVWTRKAKRRLCYRLGDRHPKGVHLALAAYAGRHRSEPSTRLVQAGTPLPQLAGSVATAANTAPTEALMTRT